MNNNILKKKGFTNFYELSVCLYGWMYVHHTCVSGAPRGQKKEMDPLELKLRAVVSHQVGALSQTQGLWKKQQAS